MFPNAKATTLVIALLTLCQVAFGQTESSSFDFRFFMPPGSQTTYPGAIDSVGQVTGFYTDFGGVFHGFLRKTSGPIIVIDPPGSVFTVARGSTPAGVVSGYYSNGLASTTVSFATTAESTRRLTQPPVQTRLSPSP